MKYELTIDAEYLDGGRWDAAAGIREFMQNGRDAAIEQGAPLDVSHRVNSEGEGVLVIENEGAVLAKDTLLLGRSTKRDRQDELAGKYGEGYKLGSLALLRAGYKVKIRNGGEVWTPSIEPSEKFNGRPVLVFNVQAGRAERNRVQVEITGVSADAWKLLRENYLFLYNRDVKKITTGYGDLLLSPKFIGRIYVKGILVNHDPALNYGYDFSDAELDRDRKIIENYDLQNRMRRVWLVAVKNNPADLFDEFYKMLKDDARDAQGLNNWYSSEMPESVQELVTARFKAEHGEDSVPVNTMADSMDVEHLGVKGVVVPVPLAAALKQKLGDLDDIKKRLAEEVKARYSWSDLTPAEKANLERAKGLVERACSDFDWRTVEVVDFRSANLQGQHKRDADGTKILIARSMLASRKDTLTVLVHEVAHQHGADGDKGHVEQIEHIWAEITDHLLGGAA